MAPKRIENTRRRKRKARTEVSSSSDSSSESEKSSHSTPEQDPTSNINEDDSNPLSKSPSEASEPSPPAPASKQTHDPETAFEDFYLKQATKEFANDIDKLRSAPDFNERNLPVLVRALKQGTACFGERERRKVGGGGQSSEA